MSDISALQNLLSPFFSDSVIDYVHDSLIQDNLQFKLSSPRKTKLGDYRTKLNSKFSFITVNNNLNPVQLLITILHELAHHHTWLKYKRNVKPHGSEWQQEYQRLFIPILTNETVPNELKRILAVHLKRPKATSYSDKQLNTYLDKTFNELVKRVADTPMNKPFILGKRTFIKEKKLRTRYLCTDLGNNKKYLIHGHTELH